MPGGARTPASMIMAGIIQREQAQLMAESSYDWYIAARRVYDKYNLLPMEAKKSAKNPNGLEVPPPPTAGDKDVIDPTVKIKCRQYCEKYSGQVDAAIPQYVYQYFERGRKFKRGY